MHPSNILLLAIVMLAGCAVKEYDETILKKNISLSTDIPAYFQVGYEPVQSIQERLQFAGFETLSVYTPRESSKIIVVATHQTMELARKRNQGFAAVTHVFVDQEHEKVIYTNPVYFSKAFLQADYNRSTATDVVQKLSDALGEPELVGAKLDGDELARYRYMVGMPRYEDVDVLAEGNASILLSKLASYEGGKNIVFELALGEGKTLVGYDLSSHAKSTIMRTRNLGVGVLPYMILIEDGKAKTLSPMYIVPLCNPGMSMSELMDLATLLGRIKKDLSAPFQ